jgi:hypothetical protein
MAERQKGRKGERGFNYSSLEADIKLKNFGADNISAPKSIKSLGGNFNL